VLQDGDESGCSAEGECDAPHDDGWEPVAKGCQDDGGVARQSCQEDENADEASPLVWVGELTASCGIHHTHLSLWNSVRLLELPSDLACR